MCGWDSKGETKSHIQNVSSARRSNQHHFDFYQWFHYSFLCFYTLSLRLTKSVNCLAIDIWPSYFSWCERCGSWNVICPHLFIIKFKHSEKRFDCFSRFTKDMYITISTFTSVCPSVFSSVILLVCRKTINNSCSRITKCHFKKLLGMC